MYTYQDFIKAKQKGGVERFIVDAIGAHKGTRRYIEAVDAEEYYKKRNVTIQRYQKFLTKITGEKIVDQFSPNYKCKNAFFPYFIKQEVNGLLGNGVTFGKKDTKAKLGKKIDNMLQRAGKYALIEGTSFGFWNLDHLEVFKLTEFVPLWDEDDGALKAGIRFWQIAPDKPLRATLYEMDGYTEYIKKSGEEMKAMKPKRAYIIKAKKTQAFGTEIYDFENYPDFPIIPCYGNDIHESELKGHREKIDCYDLIESGFANDTDTASQIYWLFKNTGGMDDEDVVNALEKIHTLKAAVVDSATEGASVEPKTVNVPTEARETLLKRLRDGLFEDFMALDTKNIASGAVVTAQIEAAYDPLDRKLDDFEYCMNDFVGGILELNGIDDEPVFNRSKITNQTEQTTMILAAAQYLDDETILKHLPFLSVDEVDGIMKAKAKEEANRFDEVNDGDVDREENSGNGQGDKQDVQTGAPKDTEGMG